MDNEVSAEARSLATLMAGKKTVVISGAGLSTGSGLPDYRGTGTTQEPSVEYDDFARDPVWQRWVWQRNQETWHAVDALSPNPGHLAIARMEKAELLTGIATQNVDNLHQKAGSEKVAELHGSVARVDCTQCGAHFDRREVDGWLEKLNPNLPEDPDPQHVAILANRDRKAAEHSTFKVAPCPRCGGLIKPSVVFFGESLPQTAMRSAFQWADAADVALVVGSSLYVSTGMWVFAEALEHGATGVILNMGPTQGDRYADLRINADASEVLSQVADLLGV
ncbi:SIR2 family NAD-dependent protein deacylase [Neoactinobaculum massilliense]|uniref:SIR2 family NAD-dependent protein deacylase n=1 Tax=Neoactinobaculum massilliense TaxID=2364794 RepID=UPI000F533FD1|nr:Sir2 family NAD-dependent protein deacetylase [Neoactinobaculum massilliense]